MQMRNKILGFGLAALIGVVPAIANAQWRHYNRDHVADGHKANAIALGAAGLILLSGHQNTLGTIALGAAVIEASQTTPDHDRFFDRRRDRFIVFGHDRDRDWDRDRDHDPDRDHDRDRDHRYRW